MKRDYKRQTTSRKRPNYVLVGASKLGFVVNKEEHSVRDKYHQRTTQSDNLVLGKHWYYNKMGERFVIDAGHYRDMFPVKSDE